MTAWTVVFHWGAEITSLLYLALGAGAPGWYGEKEIIAEARRIAGG
jgi:hypothetical protein